MLPAYAGMIPRSGAGCSGRRRAPRVCGDDPCDNARVSVLSVVLPAYAGMIRKWRRI